MKGTSQMKVRADVRELFAELCPVLCCPGAGKVAVWLRRQRVESALEELRDSRYACLIWSCVLSRGLPLSEGMLEN